MKSLFSSSWRLIKTGSLPGPENMAIDESLLSCFDPESSQPLLRLYGWSPPAFSHGRFQNPSEILDLDRCRKAGVPVVRRITGGGVIYHSQELTYSLVSPVTFITPARSVKDTFFHLTSFLITFYRKLGLAPSYAADYHGRSRPLGIRTPLCFDGIESCDILLDGKKIGGNAQRRLKELVFQHGSIPLKSMTDESTPYLREDSAELASKTTSLGQTGVTLSSESLMELLENSFAEQFNISFTETPLTENEIKTAARYMQKTA